MLEQARYFSRSFSSVQNLQVLFSEAFQTLKALNNANIRANFHTLNFCLEHPCYIRNVTFRTMVILDISCENALRIFTLVMKLFLLDCCRYYKQVFSF